MISQSTFLIFAYTVDIMPISIVSMFLFLNWPLKDSVIGIEEKDRLFLRLGRTKWNNWTKLSISSPSPLNMMSIFAKVQLKLRSKSQILFVVFVRVSKSIFMLQKAPPGTKNCQYNHLKWRCIIKSWCLKREVELVLYKGQVANSENFLV